MSPQSALRMLVPGWFGNRIGSKKLGTLVVVVSGEPSTPGNSNHGPYFPNPRPGIIFVPGLGGSPLPVPVIVPLPPSPFLGNPAKTGPGGEEVPDPNLVIYYGWHTHPRERDPWPSKVDCNNAKNDQLPEIVIYYMVRGGKDTWLIHIAGTDGQYYEWTPPDVER